jgi:DNA-directed RNA polymerase subunit omega
VYRGRFGLLGGQKLVERGIHRRRAGSQKLFQIKNLLGFARRTLFNHRHAVGVVGKALLRRKRIPKFSIAIKRVSVTLLRSFRTQELKILNAELTKKALEKVGNPNVLVNLVSRRVRQLNSGAGAISRPLIEAPASMGVADIALTEIIEEKIGFEMPELVELTRPTAKKRAKKR